ncbi:MAG TPA: DNA-binding response regulator [Chloroflexi bacterium]|jgi:two-component system response regulator MprA|nr:DNA-binding response regulator [Chloroflexota bacterium]
MGATSEQAQVLIVEDDRAIASAVRRGLAFEGYRVTVAESGGQALDLARDNMPDLVVLDIMIPGIDGLEVCRRLRAAGEDVPILMLTARDEVADRVAGLDAGADDYLVKPFAFEELVARIRALLRRRDRREEESLALNGEILRYDDLSLDTTTRFGHRGARRIDLTTREFDLLMLFLRHPNQVLPRDVIMERVWGYDFPGESNVLEVYVKNLRRLLEADGESRLLQTVRGAGYVLRRD